MSWFCIVFFRKQLGLLFKNFVGRHEFTVLQNVVEKMLQNVEEELLHLQPSHFSCGPQQGAFYRKQFVIWARVLIIIYRFSCAENKGTYGLLSTGIMLTNERLCL